MLGSNTVSSETLLQPLVRGRRRRSVEVEGISTDGKRIYYNAGIKQCIVQ